MIWGGFHVVTKGIFLGGEIAEGMIWGGFVVVTKGDFVSKGALFCDLG